MNRCEGCKFLVLKMDGGAYCDRIYDTHWKHISDSYNPKTPLWCPLKSDSLIVTENLSVLKELYKDLKEQALFASRTKPSYFPAEDDGLEELAEITLEIEHRLEQLVKCLKP